MKPTKFSISFFARLIALTCLAWSSASFAADNKGKDGAVLAEGAGVTITSADVMSEAQRIPTKSRAEILGNPRTIAELVSNLFMRRALAGEALKEGMEQDPLVQAQLQIARDRVLSDARLAKLDKQTEPDDAAQSAYAKAAYQANSARFAQPEQIHARHILIKGTSPESRAKAEALLAQLKQGADFKTLATQSSEDPGSGAKGGDLGFFEKGRMVKPFEDAAFALDKPGDLSPIVESPFGFHIIELVEKRTPGPRPFAQVESELKEESLKQSVKDSRENVVKRLSGATEVRSTRDRGACCGAKVGWPVWLLSPVGANAYPSRA